MQADVDVFVRFCNFLAFFNFCNNYTFSYIVYVYYACCVLFVFSHVCYCTVPCDVQCFSLSILAVAVGVLVVQVPTLVMSAPQLHRLLYLLRSSWPASAQPRPSFCCYSSKLAGSYDRNCFPMPTGIRTAVELGLHG